MQPKNGISFGSGALLMDDHGQMVKAELTEFADAICDDVPPECGHYIPDQWLREEITGTFTTSRTVMRNLMRILYGWKAKGPIRKRVLQRLWKEANGDG